MSERGTVANQASDVLGQHLDLDVPIGSISEGNLRLNISARGAQVVLSFFNKKAGRGFEVGFSSGKAEELNDMLQKAAKRTRGTGHG